ncbi:MAG: hypothetical protein JXA73_19585 [Acidobacteria bacterium]|nr:hypothetical protein [Acidobacteriota bacterium]
MKTESSFDPANDQGRLTRCLFMKKALCVEIEPSIAKNEETSMILIRARLFLGLAHFPQL